MARLIERNAAIAVEIFPVLAKAVALLLVVVALER